MPQQRLTFRCCNDHCPGETFSNLVDFPPPSTLAVHCPYCGARCEADFAPYRERIIEILRNGQEVAVSREVLPEVIPTTPHDEDA
jgi:hypothetical protein